jgi:hypothetical protein
LQSETGWTDAGGGCSTYETANPAQSGFAYYTQLVTYRDTTGGGNGAPCLAGYNLCAGRGSWIGTKP